MATLKSVPLEQQHLALGARMVPFSGWNMPVQYPTGILAEHHHTRQSVSLFDCSHMGQFRLRGLHAAKDLDHLLSRRVSTQKVGTCRYNLLMTPAGTVRDDLITYRLSAEEFYIVVNAGTQDGDAAWITSHLSPGTEFTNESAATAKLDPQGPKLGILLDHLGLSLAKLPGYYRFTTCQIAGIDVLLSRTGYTGELGVELYFPATAAPQLCDLILACPEVKPAGLGARDTLRLEMGYPLYGHELNDETTPFEASMAWVVELERDFIGREALRAPPRKRLVGLRLEGRRAAREGAQLFDATGEPAGKVSSGSFAPSLAGAIAMAFVRPELASPGTRLQAQVGQATVAAEVVEWPFYRQGTARQ
jgi:aminomethyltransferase